MSETTAVQSITNETSSWFGVSGQLTDRQLTSHSVQGRRLRRRLNRLRLKLFLFTLDERLGFGQNDID